MAARTYRITHVSRHVAKTGEIGQLIVTEEGGIAKGIRRLTAVTGEEAVAVTRAADAAAARLDAIERIADQGEKDAQLKAFSVELARMDMSVLRKEALKQRFAKVRKELDTALKARSAADIKAAQEAVTQYFAEHPDARVLVTQLNVGANAKAMQSGIAAARKADKPVYLFSRETSTGKTLYSNYVPQAVRDAGLDAVAWNKAVSEHLGGRGGGKPDGAQGQGAATPEQVDAALALARDMMNVKLQ